MSELLEACKSGNLEEIRRLINEGADAQTVNEEGLNGVLLAASEGNFSALHRLISEFEISPHRVTQNGENLFHIMIRSVAAKPPTEDDLAETKAECAEQWAQQEETRISQEQANRLARDGMDPPKSVGPSASEYVDEVFANPESAAIKYIMIKHRVYPCQKSDSDQTPQDLATELGLTDVASYFEKICSKEERARRLMAYMPDSIFREIVNYL